MNRKPNKSEKGIFTKGMTWRIVYQGIMIGFITLVAFIMGIATKNVDLPIIEGLSEEEAKIEIGQTMAFTVLAFSELIHVFNIRNNKESIFKTKLFNNKYLLFSVVISTFLMLVILVIPALRNIFRIPILTFTNIIEMIILILLPIVIVEIFKLFKINTIKDK